MNIPTFLDRDDYLQNPIMKRFIKSKGIRCAKTRADYINAIESYANENLDHENEVKQWITKVVKEGSKEVCYRKIYQINDTHKDKTLVEAKIREKYINCPMSNIVDYVNNGNKSLVAYNIITDETGEVSKIEFTFSQLMLYGDIGTLGDTTVFPLFLEIYLDSGFIITRSKAKSTVYEYDANNKMLLSDYKIHTMDYAISTIDDIINLFEFQTNRDKKIVNKMNSEMLYRLYKKYSFTPEDVRERVNLMLSISNTYIDKMFNELHLDIRNKERALLDVQILVEKYISINGDNEETFKKDRDAYLIKVSADDEIELTKIDTTSAKTVPLQCTEAFFDSKKSVVKSKQCKKLSLIFKRNNELYFSNNPLVIQFGTNKNYGYFKCTQYAEEEDIQNVLQAIFTNY